MFDFRLKVFDTVARRLSFTKAAEELNITQPAVTKHIKEIEKQLKVRLFDRNGTRIKLSDAGAIMLKYTAQLFGVYRDMDTELSQFHEKHKGRLRIGASTTIAQYLLPSMLAAFRKKFRDIRLSLVIQNTETIEGLLAEKKIDVGLIEGKTRNKLFAYTPFVRDEIVLISGPGNPLLKKEQISISTLKQLPLVFREPGSGTLECILYALKPLGIKLSDLRVEMHLGNTESIKSYVLHSDCLAFVSIHSVLQELNNRSLTVIDVRDLTIERDFHFILPVGEPAPVVGLFLNFARRYNFK